jgi:hypothetical protein
MAKVGRKTFVAREDLLNRISELAKEKGYTLYNMVNEIFEFAIKAYVEGATPLKALEALEELNAIRKAGFTPCMERLWYEMAEIAFREARDETLKCWFEAGIWLAKLYETSGRRNPLEDLMSDLKRFTWEASEFKVESRGGNFSVHILSPKFPESYTILFASLLEGVLEAFGYKIASKEVSGGIIRLEAFKEGGSR